MPSTNRSHIHHGVCSSDPPSALCNRSIFNLTQLVLSLIAVLEAIIVHVLFTKNKPKLALHVDTVCRLTIPLLYLLVTMGSFFHGMSYNKNGMRDLAFVLMFGTSGVVVPLTIWLSYWRATSIRREQLNSVGELRKTPTPTEKSDEYIKKVERVFHAFDNDASGEVCRLRLHYGLPMMQTYMQTPRIPRAVAITQLPTCC